MNRQRVLCAIAVVGVIALIVAACQNDADDASGAARESSDADRDPDVSTSASTTIAAADTAAPNPSEPNTITPDTPAPGTTAPGTTAPGTPLGSDTSVFPDGDIDHGLDPYIRRATDDLASRLAVNAAAIRTVSAVLVQWPDSGLGCNDPKKSYSQVSVDGSVIELESGGRIYRYHSGGPDKPFLCERPLRSTPTRI